MNVKGSASNLAQAMKELMIEWGETKVHWRDTKAQEFEGKYIDPLPNEIARTKTIMEELEAVLRKVRIDCE